MTTARPGPAARIFRVPALLGAITAFALVLALIGDGIWDHAASIALAVPLAIIAWKTVRARANDTQRTDPPQHRGFRDHAE